MEGSNRGVGVCVGRDYCCPDGRLRAFLMASLLPDLSKPQASIPSFAKSFVSSANGPVNLHIREKPGRPVLQATLRGDEEINVDHRSRSRHPSRLLQPQAESQLQVDSITLPVVQSSLLQLGFRHGNRSMVAVQPSPPPRKELENKEQNDYYVNLGSAIRTLREELPVLFSKELSYDIYRYEFLLIFHEKFSAQYPVHSNNIRDDITFRDPLNSFQGIDNYKLIFRALRFHGRIFFREIWVEIVRVWQPCDRVILIRWTLKGIPRVPWEARGRFDGMSTYKLDKNGKIYEHKVDNLAFNFPQKLRTASVLDLVTAAGCPTSPTPTFFAGSGDYLLSNFPCLEGTTWMQFYRAVKNTLDLEGAHLVYGCCRA